MDGKTRGQLEAEFTKAVIKFEKEYLGRGPLEARTFFVQDMILIRLRGIMTPAEVKLAESREGQTLFESSRPLIETIAHQIVGCNVISLHTDMSTKTGERVIILTVDTNLEERFG